MNIKIMPKRNIHVTRRKGEWAVVRERAKRASALLKTQREAINIARPMAKEDKVELVIHDKENKIRDKDSYGNDPCPPKDKKY